MRVMKRLSKKDREIKIHFKMSSKQGKKREPIGYEKATENIGQFSSSSNRCRRNEYFVFRSQPQTRKKNCSNMTTDGQVLKAVCA